jgi:hypothetical protein
MVNTALEGEKRVIPVIVDQEAKDTIPRRLSEMQWLDLSDPAEYETRLGRFASDLLGIASPRGAHKPDVVHGDRVSEFAGIDMDELVTRIAMEVAAHLSAPSNQTIASSASQSNKRYEETRSVFIVMAFTDDMEPVFEGIRDAAKAVGLEAARVKDMIGDYKISNKLIEMLQDSVMVAVDLTHERPNVYFELGYARGIGKTVITTARTGTTLHFDVRDWTCTFYSDSRLLERSLKERFAIELQNLQRKHQ